MIKCLGAVGRMIIQVGFVIALQAGMVQWEAVAAGTSVSIPWISNVNQDILGQRKPGGLWGLHKFAGKKEDIYVSFNTERLWDDVDQELKRRYEQQKREEKEKDVQKIIEKSAWEYQYGMEENSGDALNWFLWEKVRKGCLLNERYLFIELVRKSLAPQKCGSGYSELPREWVKMLAPRNHAPWGDMVEGAADGVDLEQGIQVMHEVRALINEESHLRARNTIARLLKGEVDWISPKMFHYAEN